MNQGYDYRAIVTRSGDRATLLDYLTGRYRHSSAAQWLERILRGRVLVDGRRVEPECPVREGQTVLWRRPPWREPDAPLGFAVLFRDAHLLAVAKPAGLPTLPAGGFVEHTLLNLVRRHDAQAVPVHRLGRFTSGLVLLARSGVARRGLAAAWRAGRVEKRYRALACGRIAGTGFVVEAPIGTVPHRLLGRVHAASPLGRSSRSRIRVIERRGNATLVDVSIATGRPHQIRIHLACAGHPLVGDPLYERGGGIPTGSSALPGDPGYHLHATELRLRHPVSDTPLRLWCAPPRSLRRDPGGDESPGGARP